MVHTRGPSGLPGFILLPLGQWLGLLEIKDTNTEWRLAGQGRPPTRSLYAFLRQSSDGRDTSCVYGRRSTTVRSTLSAVRSSSEGQLKGRDGDDGETGDKLQTSRRRLSLIGASGELSIYSLGGRMSFYVPSVGATIPNARCADYSCIAFAIDHTFVVTPLDSPSMSWSLRRCRIVQLSAYARNPDSIDCRSCSVCP
ncbi:hypothetical protein L226DRAFT_245508 [Lentinus tigrinus ALCF2SS1-7]|uniref:uncharacterized protein n=1 Tax=Lentinus tigrinus ALCF2SS1-7 TaxID=1328758 RepID=UPI0011660D43|nr:hypothetical protein L226DRAFT_245508 [Lentinus tigrinus ALCF2SS1-7]